MMDKRFYLICTRETVGSNASFWCHDGHGYNSSIDKAHVYTLEEAQSHWNTGRDIDQPVCADSVDALAIVHVDHQHVSCETIIEPGCNQYVAFKKGCWDGNDLYWVSNGALPTTDFMQAALFDKPGDPTDLVWLPFHIADAAKRRTFPIAMLDHRRMVQAAGLRVPAHIQRARRRKTGSGKVRFNCTDCGRIHWQLNPYEFEGCDDIGCTSWIR